MYYENLQVLSQHFLLLLPQASEATDAEINLFRNHRLNQPPESDNEEDVFTECISNSAQADDTSYPLAKHQGKNDVTDEVSPVPTGSTPHQDPVSEPTSDQSLVAPAGEDGGDAPPPTQGSIDSQEVEPAKIHTILFIIIGIGLYVVDIGTDVYLAYRYYSDRKIKKIWFGLTLLFVLLPTFLLNVFNLCLYVLDITVVKDKVSTRRLIVRVVFSVFMLGPLLR